MLETSARLLRLLALLQARAFWSGADLAEQLRVTERTIRRDVDRLRSLGYPVHSSVGVAGGYQLGAGASLPPLLLEDDEALAVALGLRTAAAGTVAGVEEAALRALAKLEQVLPKRVRRRVKALHEAVAPLYSTGPRVRPEVLSALAAACRHRECATFGYRDREGRVTTRRTEPHGLVHTGSRWYLAAWDEDRDDWRTFRVDRIQVDRIQVDRIQGAVTTGPRFVPRDIPEDDVAAYVSRSVASRPYTYRARVLFHAPISRVRERVPPLAGYLRRVGNDQCRLEIGSASLGALAVHLALVGEDFEVEDPPELIDHVRKLATRLRRATRRKS
ncbi:MAG: YafY family protein [Myxococcota bacterium]